MANSISVTGQLDEEIFINPDAIIYFHSVQDLGFTFIQFSHDETLTIKESAVWLAARIKEYS